MAQTLHEPQSETAQETTLSEMTQTDVISPVQEAPVDGEEMDLFSDFDNKGSEQ